MHKQVMAEKRKNYDLKFKMSTIKCAEDTTNRQAARKFAVDESMIRRRRKNSLKIYDESSSIIHDIHNLEDLTDKVLEQSEVEIVII